MFHPKIIEFFKKHNLYDEEMFEYILKRCDYVDYYDSDINFMVGCPAKVNPRNNRIEGFRLCIPYCWDEKTALVSVHEIAHAIYWYKRLGKKYNKIEEELFPMVVERIYLEENKTSTLESYEKFLDSTIDETSEAQYRFAIANRDHLLQSDISDFRYLDKSMRKFVRKWKRENR